MYSLDKFVAEHVTKRPGSMFDQDIMKNENSLK